MSPWQLAAQLEGWNQAQGGEAKSTPPSDEEHDALLEKYA